MKKNRCELKYVKHFISALAIFFLLCSCHNRPAPVDYANYFLLEDRAADLSAEQAWRLFQYGKFQKQPTYSFNPGFTTSYYWLVVTPHDQRDKNLELEVGTSQINEIEVYAIRNDQPVKQFVTGDRHVFDSRPISALNFIIPLSKEINHYLLKIDKKNESLQLTFRTHEADVFQKDALESSIVIGILTGIIVLMLVFGLFLTIITKESVYAFYVLYITAGWLYVLANTGFGYQYLWPGSPWFAERARPVFTLLTLSFSIHFIEAYAGNAKYRWLRVCLRAFAYFAYALTVVALVPEVDLKTSTSGYYFQVLLPILAVLYLVIILITLIQKLVNKNKMAMFYLASMLPIVLFSVLQISYYSGGVDFSGSYLQNYGQATGYMMEAVILTFGLAYRFNSYRLEKELLLVNLNRQQVKYAKAIISTQEHERRQLADQLHDVAGSLLSAAKLNLSAVREKNFITNSEARVKLANAEEAITDISEMLRRLSHAISPVMLDKVGFRQSVEKVVAIFNSSGKIVVELEMLGFETEHPELHEKYAILYGILYELMNNIAKHAQATHALVQLIEHDDSIALIVEDNGVGMNAHASGGDTQGLTAIQSKLHYLNGTFVLDKAIPHGLIVTIEIPKESNEKNYPG